MLCFLQLALAALGVAVMRKKAIRVGGQVCGGSFPMLIGLLLLIQFVVCVGFGFAIGFEEGMKSAKAGKSQPNVAAIEKLQQKYLWVDVCVPIGALCLSGLLLYAGLKDPPSAEPEWEETLPERGEYRGYDDRADPGYGGRGRDDRY